MSFQRFFVLCACQFLNTSFFQKAQNLNAWFGILLKFGNADYRYTDDEFYLTDESGAVISNTYTCRTHYLDIPVLVKFFPCNRLNVQFGPQLGIGLSLSDKWKGINNDYSIYRDSAVDFSLAFGLGYEFNFGVFVDARYTLGLTKTIREVVKGFQGRNISLAVGYRVYL